jgi:hypothetical protein
MKRFCALRPGRKTTGNCVLGCADGNEDVRQKVGSGKPVQGKNCDRVHWISSLTVLVIKRLRANTPWVLCSQGPGPLF